MIIEYCDEYDNVIVKMSKSELSTITLKKFGDKYGNNGLAFDKRLIGRNFEINELSEKLYRLKVFIETKNKILNELKDLEKITTQLTWSISESKEAEV